MRKQFKNDDFQFGFEIALGAAARGSSDPGEVLATADRIKDGNADSWVTEWEATADACATAGERALAAGHRTSALSHYRRASRYYASALYAIVGSKQADRRMEVWTRQRECWDHVVDLSPTPGERISIPYEGTTLPAYFFRAPGATTGEKRPLVIVNNGSDGATSDMWLQGGAAAAERGYHWMTFDGPGQQAALFLQGIHFRPDWEAVLTPVVDSMLERADVDAARIAVIGISQAGYWVPRALAFEHRLAAAVADPGVVDVATSWTGHLPKSLLKELAEGKKKEFDRYMGIGERFSHSAKAVLAFRGEPYGIEGGSDFDLFTAVLEYKLGDEVKDITTPLLITNPEDEQFWPGQSQQLHDLLEGPKELVAFTAHEGANRHCEPMGILTRDARVFDWLEGYLA